MKKFGVKISLLVIIFTLALLLVACGGEGDYSSSADGLSEVQTTSAADRASEVEQTLKIAAGRSFWQGSATMIYLHGSTNVWESLVMFDDELQPEMKLAQSVVPSEDGLTWTITLNQGILFHDGSELTAEVALFNLERIFRFNPATRAFEYDFGRVGEFGPITGFDIVSDYVFTVTHEIPVPDFDARLSYENSAMFAMASFEGSERIISHPYGTGPFYYDSFDEANQILTLQAFEGYRLGSPKLDTILFYNIPDAATRLAALQSGEIDVIADVGAIMPAQAAAILNDDNLILRQRQVSTVHYVALNSNEGAIFNDVRLRNAVSLSVDRDAIVQFLLLGYGEPAISVISGLAENWVVDSGYRFDPQEAAKLVGEVGAIDGEAVILINSGLTGRWPYQDVAVMLQAQLRNIGLDSRIETVDAATWTERLREGDYDITIHPFTISAGGPNFFFTRNIQTGGSNNVLRSYGISNPQLDELINKAATEPDANVRGQLYAQLQMLVRQNDYIIPIWYDVTLYAMNKSVHGFELDALFWPDLFVVSIG